MKMSCGNWIRQMITTWCIQLNGMRILPQYKTIWNKHNEALKINQNVLISLFVNSITHWMEWRYSSSSPLYVVVGSGGKANAENSPKNNKFVVCAGEQSGLNRCKSVVAYKLNWNTFAGECNPRRTTSRSIYHRFAMFGHNERERERERKLKMLGENAINAKTRTKKGKKSIRANKIALASREPLSCWSRCFDNFP